MESTTAGGYSVLAVLVVASAPCRAMETPPLGKNAPFFLVPVEISGQIQMNSVLPVPCDPSQRNTKNKIRSKSESFLQQLL